MLPSVLVEMLNLTPFLCSVGKAVDSITFSVSFSEPEKPEESESFPLCHLLSV